MQQARMRKNNLLAVSITAVLGLGASESAFAVNGFQVIGYGEDQVAVGGAVTANPTSAMTALTNPAGLTMIGERADFSMQAFMPDVKLDATNSVFTGNSETPNRNPGGTKKSSGDFYGIPSIGWVGETGVSNLYFGGGMYATAGLGADFGSVNLNTQANPPAGNTNPTVFNGYSNVSMFRISPAVGYKISPQLSVGAALNVNMLMLGFRETFTNMINPANGSAFDINFNLGRAGQAFGLGGTVGLMFDPVPGLMRLGASYTTKANFQDTEFELAAGDISGFPDVSAAQGNPNAGAPNSAGTYKAAFDFPQQAAVGLALMPEGPLTLSADVKWINYKDTLKDFYVTGNGRTWNLQPKWDDVWVYAAGATYKPMPGMKFMVGYNYSDAPVSNSATFNNLIFPAIVKHHITTGFNYQLGKNWDIGGALQYIPKETITGEGDLQQPDGSMANSNIKVSNQITSIGMNLGYRF